MLHKPGEKNDKGAKNKWLIGVAQLKQIKRDGGRKSWTRRGKGRFKGRNGEEKIRKWEKKEGMEAVKVIEGWRKREIEKDKKKSGIEERYVEGGGKVEGDT